ncbi:MAG: hydrogenase maturation protease [Cyanobacteria bacterium P01_A01_bin.40]
MVGSLIIGYGSSLRGDDGIGLEVAQIISEWKLLEVRSLYQHQLTPELAAELALVDLAIFIDACQSIDKNTVEVHPIKPSSSIEFRSHFGDPRILLSLTKALFNRCPQAWWILVPGSDFELKDCLSPLAKQGIKEAVKQVKNLLAERTVPKSGCTK